MGYVIDSSAPAEAKASHPLSEARVDVWRCLESRGHIVPWLSSNRTSNWMS